MARENITLHHRDEYTFTTNNVGKYRLIATKPNTDYNNKENVFTDKTIEIILPTSDEDIDIIGTTTEPFISGTDLQYFSVLYKYTGNSEYSADELNAAAITYIKDWNSVASNEEKIDISNISSEQPTYFGTDGNGIYALLQKNKDFSNRYHESIIKTINGQEYIKAYVKGTCRIIDTDYKGSEDKNMISSIAYPFTFKYSSDSNKLVTYLFINTEIGLVHNIDTNKKTISMKPFWEDGLGENSSETYKYNIPFNSFSLYKDESIETLLKDYNNFFYILKQATYNYNYKLNTIENSNEDIPMMIKEGTNRHIIIPETVKKISHFYGGSNATNIILPNSLVEIGESAFEGISGGSISLRSYNNNLKTIGFRAFANIQNIDLFAYNIKEQKAFIIDNMCRGDNETNSTKLSLNKEQLSNLLDNLVTSESNLKYTLLPRVERIETDAFYGASSGTSIKNIIFTNILTEVYMWAFENTYINNLIIPKALIARPKDGSYSGSSVIKNSNLLYLPEKAIGIACSQDGDMNSLSTTYSSLMKDEAKYNDYGSNGYTYTHKDITGSWLGNTQFDTYKNTSKDHATFKNLSGNPHFYFIDHKTNS